MIAPSDLGMDGKAQRNTGWKAAKKTKCSIVAREREGYRPAWRGEKGNRRKRGKINGHNSVRGVIREEHWTGRR